MGLDGVRYQNDQTLLQKLQNAAEQLTKLGHSREAIPVYREWAEINTRLARECHNTSEKHAYYVQVGP